MRVRVTRPFAYDGRQLAAGSEHEFEDALARWFVQRGNAERVEGDGGAAAPRSRYKRRDMRTEK